jgi:hypothetical protein
MFQCDVEPMPPNEYEDDDFKPNFLDIGLEIKRWSDISRYGSETSNGAKNEAVHWVCQIFCGLSIN